MQAQTPYLTVNPFEQLCFLASDEEWCWNLFCTTCGHSHFRYSFAELASGKSPADRDWLIHRRRTRYEKQLGRWPREYNDVQKCKILEICSEADISLISGRCKFPDWLGYLGLVLEHMRCDHEIFGAMSSQWAMQLKKLVPPNTPVHTRLEPIMTHDNELLNIEDLERVEYGYSRVGQVT